MRLKVVKDNLCKKCGASFKPFNTLQPVCSPKCAVAYNSKKEVDKRVKVMRKESQSLPELKALARSVFQTWVRIRDQNEVCISCSKTSAAQWDGIKELKSAQNNAGKPVAEFIKK